jgi:hypothetical protein
VGVLSRTIYAPDPPVAETAKSAQNHFTGPVLDGSRLQSALPLGVNGARARLAALRDQVGECPKSKATNGGAREASYGTTCTAGPLGGWAHPSGEGIAAQVVPYEASGISWGI